MVVMQDCAVCGGVRAEINEEGEPVCYHCGSLMPFEEELEP